MSPAAELWTSDSAGGNARLLFASTSNWWVTSPRWSHDGTKIAFNFGATGGLQTWVVNADGSDPRWLPDIPANYQGPKAFWSIDDRRLLFVSGASSGGLGYVDVDGPGSGHVFEGTLSAYGGDREGELSPDGSRIAFLRYGGGVGRVFVVDIDGTDLVKVSDPVAGDTGLVHWSPDGNRLLFESGAPGMLPYSQLTVMNADGTDRRILHDHAQAVGMVARRQPDPVPGRDPRHVLHPRLHGDAHEGRRHWHRPLRRRPGGRRRRLGRPPADDGGDLRRRGPHARASVPTGGCGASGRAGWARSASAPPTEVPTPTLVPGLGPVYAISGGVLHSVAVMDDATVRAWGWNVYGQVGDGTTTDRRLPTPVAGLSSMLAASAGLYHSLAVRSDGTVWAWGWNALGQLGDGTTTDRHSPVQVSGLTDVVAVAAGAYHSLALRADGTVWAWGYNGQGELGTGVDGRRRRPDPCPRPDGRHLAQRRALPLAGHPLRRHGVGVGLERLRPAGYRRQGRRTVARLGRRPAGGHLGGRRGPAQRRRHGRRVGAGMGLQRRGPGG